MNGKSDISQGGGSTVAPAPTPEPRRAEPPFSVDLLVNLVKQAGEAGELYRSARALAIAFDVASDIDARLYPKSRHCDALAHLLGGFDEVYAFLVGLYGERAVEEWGDVPALVTGRFDPATMHPSIRRVLSPPHDKTGDEVPA